MKRSQNRTASGLADLQRRHGYLAQTGWLRSARKRHSVDRRGRPIPWYTYPATSFLQARVHAKIRVFEWGMGSSTLWWSSIADLVASVEHDFAWYSAVSKRLGTSNAKLHYLPLENGDGYSEIVLQHPGCNLIAVDGVNRGDCINQALKVIPADGVILIDNTEREAYRPSLQVLQDTGFRQIAFCGLGPIGTKGWKTSVFYRDGNCLGI